MGKLASNQEYAEWLTDLKLKIRRNQVKAAIQVNETLLRLYSVGFNTPTLGSA